MLGWMTEKQAKQNGFTHHGSYYGIPLWMSDDDQQPDNSIKITLI